MNTYPPNDEASGVAARERAQAVMVVCVAVAAAVGMLLRSLHAMRPLWFDELYSVVMADFPVREIPGIQAVYDIHPPLYSILLHAWMAITPGDEASLRMLSVMLTYGTVAILMVAAWRWRSAELAVVVLALALTAPILTRISLELRHHALLSLLSAIVLVPLVGILNERSRWYDVPLLIGAGIAALYTHYLAGIYLAVVFGLAWLLAPTSRSRWQLIVAAGMIAAAFLPWLPTMKRQMALDQALFLDLAFDLPLAQFPNRFLALMLGSAGATSRPLGLLFAVLLTVAAFRTIYRWRANDAKAHIGPQDRFEGFTLLLWVVGPAVFIAINVGLSRRPAPLTYLECFGQISILMMALAIHTLPTRARSAALGLSLAISVLCAGDQDFYGMWSDKWDVAARCFEQRVDDNDAVIFSNGITRDMLAHYAPGARETFANPAPYVYARTSRQPVAANEMRSYVAGRPTVWVLNAYTGLGPAVRDSLPEYTAAEPFLCGPVEFVRLSRSK